MAGENRHLITDFVDKQAIDSLGKLRTEMDSIKNTYVEVAKELAKGLNMKVESYEDLKKMEELLAKAQKNASEAAAKQNRIVQEQQQIVANTTNTISRHLAEVVKEEKAQYESYNRHKQVRDILAQTNETYSSNLNRLVKVNLEIEKLNERKRKEKELYDKGMKPQAEYRNALVAITRDIREAQVERQRLNEELKREEKLNQSAGTSYDAMSQQLQRLRRAYRELDEEGREGEVGERLLGEIGELSKHLTDIDATMNEYHRNVGNYAIASQNGVTVTEDLNRVLSIESETVAGCIEQNKSLEQAKTGLSKTDKDYARTVERINAKIEENKMRILDVDEVLHKQAITVAEAEQQNKQLAEALKLIDLTAEGAKQRIEAINAKIADNKQLIEDAIPVVDDYSKASEGLAGQMLSLIGISTNFGSSFIKLGEDMDAGGSLMDGFAVKLKALGSTCLGLFANPYILTILGIAGAGKVFKWWYDYNVGIQEATKLTKEFTGKTGHDLKDFRSEIAGVADCWGKDFKEVLAATDSLAVNFGITFEESLDTIKDGFVAGADESGNMLSKMQQFAPAFYEAGLSAQEFTAIITQTKSGIFGDKGLEAIKTATERIRRMPEATAEALDSLGMSSKEIQKGLTEGTDSIMDVIKQVSGKLKELPDDSQQVGETLKEVFGKKGADAGLKMIRALADIETNLDTVKAETDELGKLQEQQMESQIELEKTIAAVFDSTGGTFERMTTGARVFVNKGLTAIIKGCVDIVNWFIRLHNKSMAVRYVFENIRATFKITYDVIKACIVNLIDQIKAFGTMVEGVLTLDPKKISDGWEKGIEATKKNVVTMFKDVAKDAVDGYNSVIQEGDWAEIPLKPYSDGKTDKAGSDKNGGTYTPSGPTKEEIKAELKLLADLEDAKLKLMADGHEKDMAQIRLNYKKKLEEIKGSSDTEKKLRVTLAESMTKELAECERTYQENLAKTNVANRLAFAKKGSEEERNLKIAQLEQQREAELRQAEKTGADTVLIEQKYAKLKQNVREEYALARIKRVQESYAAQATLEDNEFNQRLVVMKKSYDEALKAAGSNAIERERITKDYESRVAEITEQYAVRKAQASVKQLEEVLKTEELADDERIKLESELAKAKIDLENAVADASIASMDRVAKADEEAFKKRIQNAQKYMQIAADALNAVNGLAQAVFDGKIQRIEEEQEALNEKYEEDKEREETAASEEQVRISDLVEKQVITKEEGEARKRAAEANTAARQKQLEEDKAKRDAELEKKKAELQTKAARLNKANSLIQAAIATATGIMQTIAQVGWPLSIPMVAATAALGAIQMATIAAQPIPKYAKGTKDHPGGAAIVGDAGKQEVVDIAGSLYLTPSTPVLLDLPKGAKVYPDVEQFISETVAVTPAFTQNATRDMANITLDTTSIERKLDSLSDGIKSLVYHSKAQSRQIAQALADAEYEHYKESRI